MKIQIQQTTYTVQTDHDATGAVQAFRLVDDTGEIAFEADYACDTLTINLIDEELQQSARFLRDPRLQAAYPVRDTSATSSRQSTKESSSNNVLPDLSLFDQLFPQYADEPLENKQEAWNVFDLMADESMTFRQQCVAEYFELRDE